MNKPRELGLIYVPDEKVYYYKRYGDWKVSQIFKTYKEAQETRLQGKIEWR